MRHRKRLAAVCAGLVLGILSSGCEPANRYRGGAAPATPAKPTVDKLGTPQQTPAEQAVKPPPKPPTPGLTWLLATPSQMEPEVRIEFVSAADNPQDWGQLKQFWTVAPANPAYFGLPPLPATLAAAVQQSKQVVKVKVPRGLDDPTPHIPLANPPTVGKWALGKKLFFDDSWLEGPVSRQSCVGCHHPDKGFTSPRVMPIGSPDSPTLVNTIFNTYLFWDGRANALEEVVNRSLVDDPPTAAWPGVHSWSGVVQRLRANPEYRDRFAKVFGTQPTQDAIGKALATYMRTILSGNSVHDQAMQAMRDRKANMLAPTDFEKALAAVDAATFKEWDREGVAKPEVAKELHNGWALFNGKARCIKCHSGANFTDNSFHNLGYADSHEPEYQELGKENGRFAALPIGLKDPRMIGAYKTPTLRNLPDKRGYFHDGLYKDLFEVVAFHTRGGTMNPYLDPELRDDKDPGKPRNLDLKEPEIRALVLFLQALEGEAVPAVIREPEQQPEAPK